MNQYVKIVRIITTDADTTKLYGVLFVLKIVLMFSHRVCVEYQDPRDFEEIADHRVFQDRQAPLVDPDLRDRLELEEKLDPQGLQEKPESR